VGTLEHACGIDDPLLGLRLRSWFGREGRRQRTIAARALASARVAVSSLRVRGGSGIHGGILLRVNESAT